MQLESGGSMNFELRKSRALLIVQLVLTLNPGRWMENGRWRMADNCAMHCTITRPVLITLCIQRFCFTLSPGRLGKCCAAPGSTTTNSISSRKPAVPPSVRLLRRKYLAIKSQSHHWRKKRLEVFQKICATLMNSAFSSKLTNSARVAGPLAGHPLRLNF